MKSIADEMKAAGQGFALSSKPLPAPSGGGVGCVRDALKTSLVLGGSPKMFDCANAALAALDRIEGERVRLYARCHDEITKRDRAIDEKHKAVQERNLARAELAAIKEGQNDVQGWIEMEKFDAVRAELDEIRENTATRYGGSPTGEETP